jgi:RND family efflux transporter MFP subunit
MKHAWILILAIAITGAGCGNSPATNSASSGAPPSAEPAPASPATNPSAPAASRDGQDIMSVLSVEHELDVVSGCEGRVLRVLRDEGSHVKAGDELARIDDEALQLGVQKAQNDLQVARSNVKWKEAELKARQAAHRRQILLRSNGLSSEADLEASEFEESAASYSLDGWRSMVKSDEAEVRSTQVELEKTHIRAPFSGVVVQRYLRQGQNISKNDKCFRVSELGPLRVQFQVPETSPHRPRIGEAVRVSIVSIAGKTFPATIIKMSPTVDPASGSYDVTAQLSGKDLGALMPGMTARVLWLAAPTAYAAPAKH